MDKNNFFSLQKGFLECILLKSKEFILKRVVYWFQIFVITSCTSNFYSYEADWILDEISVNESNIIDTVGMYNFKIDVDNGIGSPSGIFVDNGILRTDCKIKFYKNEGRDYMVISEHFFFNDTYLVKCLDDNCCSLFLDGTKIEMTLNHNRNISFNRKDKCPELFY